MSRLAQRFNIKNLGEAQKRLGIWINRTTDGIFLHQQQSTIDLLEKFDKVAVTKRPDDVKENSICEENAEEEGRCKDFQNDRLDEDEIEASKNNYIGSDDHGTDMRAYVT
ncbi:mitochondrial protein [Phytophthora palmivora]|uniref:Mitochondrial protein n=1 Tax=Phytophthora palmivora TaxID=4796 RepID=A0A2P4YIY8_9STRA|nr:mitochondrial protein [Phytophthora palmivora]